MSDVVFIDSGTNTPISTDYVDIGGTYQHVQRMKLMDGTDNSAATISGDSLYGLDVDVTRIPNITLSSQSSPFTTPVNISGGNLHISTIPEIAGTVGVNSIPSIVLSEQVAPFTTPLSVSGDINSITNTVVVAGTLSISGGANIGISGQLPAGDNNIGNVDVATIPSIVLEAQPNPFTESIDVTISNASLSTTVSNDISIDSIPSIVLESQPNPFTESIGVSITNASISTTVSNNISVDSIPSVILESQPNPFTEAIDVTITNSMLPVSGSVTATFAEEAVVESGGSPPAKYKLIAGIDDTGVVIPAKINDGALNVSISQSVPVYTSNGTNVSISGWSGIRADVATEETGSGWILKGSPTYDSRLTATDVYGVNALNTYILNSGGQAGFVGVGGSFAGEAKAISVDNLGRLETVISGGYVTISGALPAGDNNIGNVDIVTIPNITLASQANPFTSPINISGAVNANITNASIPVTGTFWQETQPVSISQQLSVIAGGTFEVSGNDIRVMLKDPDGTDLTSSTIGSYRALDVNIVNQDPITISGAINQNGTWNIGTVSTITNVVHIDDNASTISIDDGGGAITVDGSVSISAMPNEGQQTMANSISVAIASNQSSVPVDEEAIGTAGSSTTDGKLKIIGGFNGSTYEPVNIDLANNLIVTAGDTIPITGTVSATIASTVTVSGVVNPYCNLSDIESYSGNVSDNSAHTVFSAAVGKRHYISHISIMNAHASVSTVVKFFDGANVIYQMYALAGGGGVSAPFSVPLRCSVNTNLIVSGVTNGSDLYINVVGFSSTN